MVFSEQFLKQINILKVFFLPSDDCLLSNSNRLTNSKCRSLSKIGGRNRNVQECPGDKPGRLEAGDLALKVIEDP